MEYLLIVIGLLILGIGILKFLFKTGDLSKQFYKAYSPEGLLFIKKLEEIFENNESLSSEDLFKLSKDFFTKSNITDLRHLQACIGIDSCHDESETSLKYIAGDYFLNLIIRLEIRHNLEHDILDRSDKKETMEKYNVNIKENEYLYSHFPNVDMYEEKTITHSVNYGGLQYKMSLGGGLSYRMGNMKVSPIKSQEFKVVDRGDLYVTNERVIFVGNNNRVNKTFKIDDLVEFDLFKDGVLLGKTNGKKPLLLFPDYVVKVNEAPNKRDDLNKMIRVLGRIMRNNQDQEVLC